MFEQQVNLGPGTGTTTQHTFEILIMLLGAFLLGLWLGWMLWNKYKQEAEKLRFEVQSLTVTTDALNKEMIDLKSKLSASEANNFGLIAKIDKLSEENRLFQEQLSQEREDLVETEFRNRQLETELGLSFAPPTATPETIPLEITEQPAPPADSSAFLPSEEPPTVADDAPTTHIEIIETVIVSEETNDDATPEAPAEQKEPTPVVAEKMEPASEPAPPVAAAAANEKDDLTVIEGIGPKIQELLHQYGIRTYKQLADAEVTRLKEILAAAGPQLAMHDPGTWPSQANLAANDQWEQLKSIQGFLKGGKTPH